jgi:hypothetical protein
MGYTTRCCVINAVDVGGAITKERLLVARVHAFLNHLWTWGDLEAGEEVTRPKAWRIVGGPDSQRRVSNPAWVMASF